MSNTQPVDNANIFQKHLVPKDSHYVRYCMIKAGELGKSKNFFYARMASVALAISAVVMSAFKALSYLLQIPAKLILNVVRFDFIELFIDFATDLANVARSAVLVAFGTTYVFAGLLFPDIVFPFFAPKEDPDQLKILENENQKLNEHVNKLDGEKKVLIGINEKEQKYQLDMIERGQTLNDLPGLRQERNNLRNELTRLRADRSRIQRQIRDLNTTVEKLSDQLKAKKANPGRHEGDHLDLALSKSSISNKEKLPTDSQTNQSSSRSSKKAKRSSKKT